MNRMLAGAALAVAIVGSTAAYAAGATSSSSSSTAPAATSSTPAPAASTKPAPVDYAARCTSLAEQWKTAEAANATNAKLGKAKASAAKGEKLCKSTKSSDEKKGAAAYESALKLLGVTTT